MVKKSSLKLEGVGWKFWSASFLVLLGPSLYLGWLIRYEDVSSLVPGLVGIMVAALGAGVVSWIVNSALHSRHARARKAERKQNKSKKKKKGKKR